MGESALYRKERDVLEKEMRKIDRCGMGNFGTLENSERTIAILGARWWPQTIKQEGDKLKPKKNEILPTIWKKRHERPTTEVTRLCIESRNGAPSRKRFMVDGQIAKASNK